jgi:hypothetical protein
MRARAWLFLLLLTGCAALGPANDAAIVSEAVALAVATARAPQDLRRRELELASQAFERDPGTVHRTRLAVLLATLPAPERDDARAASLLEPVAARQPESDLSRFAQMLADSIAERRQRAAAAQAASERAAAGLRAAGQRADTIQQQLESTQREMHAVEQREAALRKQVDALKREARASEYREETLRRQIQALRAAERSTLEREQRLPVKPR